MTPLEFFISKGWSNEQAQGIVANLSRESAFNHNAVGDNGQAYGLAQWHHDRQANFQKVFNKSIRQSSFEEQLAFVHHELTQGAEQAAGNRLKQVKTAADAESVVRQYYERPAKTAAIAAAGRASVDLFQKTTAKPPITLFGGEAAVRRTQAGDLFQGNAGQDAALTNSVMTKNDKAARILQMQFKTGLPTSVIESNLDKIEQETKRADFNVEKFRAQSPLLAAWLAKNPMHGAVAQDDYHSLTALEQLWATAKALPQGITEAAKGLQLSYLDYEAAAGTISPQQDLERKRLASEVESTSMQNMEGAPSWTKALGLLVGQLAPMGAEAVKQGAEKGIALGAPAGMAMGALYGGTAGSIIPGAGTLVGVEAGALAGGVFGGVQGMRTVATASFAEQTYRQAVGNAYRQFEGIKDADGNPIDPTAARMAAIMVGIPNTAIQFASLSKILKAVPGGEKLIGVLPKDAMAKVLARPSVMAAVKGFSKRYAGAVGSVAFMTGLQQMVNIIGREVATGDVGAGVTRQDWQSIVESAVIGAKGVAMLGGAVSAPKVIELYHDMNKAAKTEQFMKDLGNITSESKVYKESPQALRDYVDHLKESGPVKDVFISVDKWDALFQDQAPDAAKEVFGNLDQYLEAKTIGGPDGHGDLVVPIGLYAEKLAGTKFHEALIGDTRLGPNELTPNEARAIARSEPEIVEALKKEMAETDAKNQPLLTIYGDVYQKALMAGRNAFEANREAGAYVSRLVSRASRLNMDPLALYNEQPLTLREGLPPEAQDALQKYNQQLVEPAVPTPQRLPLPGGKIKLPKATPIETKTAVDALAAAQASEQDFGVFGATIHPTKGNLSGQEGVAVAGYPQRGVVTDGAPTARDIEVFMRRNRDIFKADKNAALGLWVDSDTGKGYIDITNVLPREQAVAQGESLGELAVWDLGKGEEIRLPTQKEVGQQVLFQGERGASIPGKNLIAFLKDSDPTTFVHEASHLWLEELRQDAMRRDAPEQLKADWETAKKAIGATDLQIPLEAHEKFARMGEAYVMKGEAPSLGLREIFAQWKEWFIRVYKNADILGVEISPEMRDVMDRLWASDEAIKAARERNTYDVLLLKREDMTEAEWKTYTDMIAEAKAKAEDTFRVKVMKELRAERLEEWRKEKRTLEKSVRAEILENPIYQAAYFLWAGLKSDGTKIEGLASTKLDKQTLLDMGVNLKDLPFRYTENGLHPDVVAQMFGLPSGEALVRELIGLPSLKKAIDEEVKYRMRESHGDLMLDPNFEDKVGMEVQNTRQIDVFNFEMRILKRMGARKETTHPAIVKDIARQIIGRKKISELNPKVYEAAALKAAQEADDAMLGQEFRAGTGRNLDKALDAKARQMLNIYLYREAVEARETVDSWTKVTRKFLSRSDERLARTRNMDMVNAARAIASVHGMGVGGEAAADVHMRALADYDPQTYMDMKDIVELASADGRTIEDMSYDDFKTVQAAIDGLWHLAARSKQSDIDGKMIARSQIVGDLNGITSSLIPPGFKRAGYERRATKWEKTKRDLLGAGAFMRRIEFWVDAMDSGDPHGFFRKYIWNPISFAADMFRDQRRIYLEKYLELVKSIPKDVFAPGKIDAVKDLNYTFDDKVHLLGAMMHMGNDSNRAKFLIPKGWATFDAEGNLDTSRWDAFVKRMEDEGVVTKADYDYMQAVGDLFEELKPEAWKTHKEIYGFYPDEVTRRPFKTQFGDYAGWYYPALADPFMVEDAAIHQEKEAMESKPSSFIFPTTGRGSLRNRNENYRTHLTMDLGLIPQHIEKVLRFTHMEKYVKDVGRIITDKNFREVLANFDSEIAQVALVPWLQRSALQQVEQPSGPRLQNYDQYVHALRTNVAMNSMVFNASVALQQLTGIFQASTKVEWRYLAGALVRYVTSPGQYANAIAEDSSFMRNRSHTVLFEMQRNIDNIMLNPSRFDKGKAFMREHGYILTSAIQNMVDHVVWGGAYEKATREGYGEVDARRIADSAVRETQGSFNAEDISRLEAGNAFSRLFTMFYSYFNMSANLNATEFIKARRQGGFAGASRALYVYAFGFAIPNIIAEAISQGVSGDLWDDKDDDGYLDTMGSIFFGSQVKGLTAMVPGAGQVIQVMVNRFDDKWYNDHISTSPAVNAIEAAGRVPYDAYKIATEDEVAMRGPIHDALTLIGLVSGVPVGPLAKPLGYIANRQQGEYEEPENALETTRGLISGRASR
jgi:hypothetical protein